MTGDLVNSNPGRNIAVGCSLDVTNMATGQTVRTIPDNLLEVGPRTYEIVEAKFSRVNNLTKASRATIRAAATTPQRTVFDWISTGQPIRIVPAGNRAAQAGLPVGGTITISPNIRIGVNNPNGGVVYRTW